MGISRFSQDLRPYLERCVVTSQLGNDLDLRITRLVIDGPSLVYHVYSKLTTYRLGTGLMTRLSSLPSYAQLNAAVDCFISDLESSGAAIQHIYFDGGLPLAKRPIRLERLEKSRAQLQFERLANPVLNFRYADADGQNQGGVGEALWQTRSKGTIASTDLAAPFIVPAVIEHLKKSKWASAVSVVPGEAESFCAPAARASNTAVLTNDSDLVLFEDLASNGAVVLLHSLSLVATGDARVLQAQCWRPEHIVEKLELDTLLGLGFERSKDSTALFGTVLQRAKNSRDTRTEDLDYIAFSSQFYAPSRSTLQLSECSDLTGFDPRLAELVSQLDEQFAPTAQPNSFDLHTTLPILHEDVTRDSSWSYGKPLRHAAYCLLFLHKLKSSKEVIRSPSPSVTESSRKGQRISQDLLPMSSSHEPISSAKDHISQLSQHLTATSTLATPPAPAIGYILWALHTVINQRLAAGKQSFSRNLVEQFLGVAPLPSERSQRARAGLPLSDEVNGWTLLHLNANVQAVLYSARMLKQTVDFLSKEQGEHQVRSDGGITKLAQALDLMPPIQDIFLDPLGTRTLMQRVPQERLIEMACPIFDGAGWSSHDASNTSQKDTAEPEMMVVRKSKKRKKGTAEQQTEKSAEPSKFKSTNLFDMLV
ncbi:hypothetical protein PMZ80_007848 [Knufia obscura]|uniref:Asteroid domain-containing protein n=1 Tax=Knufia obscura TaxID=1635080 RepID=A0ABR0RFS1_9EURO|nr:hypothetical protein PMZ80_007848 [Knufia obscura]